ncbi:MAG: DUF302 domain-containing protein [Pseudomonadota bacterium]|nr:DUF302 domain-containing protein [Pseudomonadota bacterium]
MIKVGKMMLLLCSACVPMAAYSETSTPRPDPRVVEVSQTVLLVPLKEGVTPQDAVDAMINKATELNTKLVSHLRISRELHSRGVKSRHLEVVQLCTPEDAAKAIELNLTFAGYVPCRIALVEDANGIVWATMQNLDFQIDGKLMQPASVELAIRINQQMLVILTAGVNGEL